MSPLDFFDAIIARMMPDSERVLRDDYRLTTFYVGPYKAKVYEQYAPLVGGDSVTLCFDDRERIEAVEVVIGVENGRQRFVVEWAKEPTPEQLMKLRLVL